ncbi:unnamed protein product [Arabis nemorensis]|uniref:Ferritin-like diiron domain-containing protein n=1 Tax=Arabis nemorensis TaxID=586526 RepID=A0A565BC56_9BRAS|nr:unnamed protein product [Arabis nemorensis]
MREQKEEIKKLKDTINELKREGEIVDMKFPTDFSNELKNYRDECVMLKQEVLILKERNNGLRNVIIKSSVGFAVAADYILHF